MTPRGPVFWLTGEYPRATDTFIQREVEALRARGVEVHTASIRRTGAEHHVGPEQREELARTFHVLEATANPLILLAAHGAALARAPGRYLRALALAWRTAPKGIVGRLYNLIYFAEAGVLVRQMRRAGAVHLHNHIAKSSCTVAMLASEMSGIPYSFTLHGPDIFFAPEHWRLDEKIARARFVACISAFCRSQAMVWSDPAHWVKLHIVHCAVDPARYRAGARDGGHLIFVGRLAGVKGVPILIDALARLAPQRPGLRLTVIGDGPERPMIEARARRAGLMERVGFEGFRGQAEVAEALAGADIFVLPSFAEGLPVVLMEALAAECPVITTHIAGVPELVRDGEAGLLVPPGEVGPLVEALERLLDDPELRARMGRFGRKVVEAEFDMATEAAKLDRLMFGDGP